MRFNTSYPFPFEFQGCDLPSVKDWTLKDMSKMCLPQKKSTCSSIFAIFIQKKKAVWILSVESLSISLIFIKNVGKLVNEAHWEKLYHSENVSGIWRNFSQCKSLSIYWKIFNLLRKREFSRVWYLIFLSISLTINHSTKSLLCSSFDLINHFY